MPRSTPAQTSFAAGEVSPRMAGRVDAGLYAKALAYDANFQLMPHGSMLMRAGSVLAATWPEATEPRLFAFRRLGEANDVVLAVSDGTARAYDRDTGVLSFLDTLISNGHFDGGSTGWALAGGAAWAAGAISLPHTAGTTSVAQTIVTTVGVTYTLKARVRVTGFVAGTFAGFFNLDIAGAFIKSVEPALEATWVDVTHTWVAAGVSTEIKFSVLFGGSSAGVGVAQVDDVLLNSDAQVAHDDLTVPWTNAQLDDLQYAPDRSKNRAAFAHPNVNPFVIWNIWSTVWEAYAAEFMSRPTSWGGLNWPGVVEWGYQGRAWWASTPSDPNELWGSKSGSPFDFTNVAAPAVASDPIDVLVSTKGTIEWLMGHHVLLAGSEAGEHGVSGSAKVITAADIDVSDESAFGAASVQAAHIGDQVVFVTPDRRHVRALTYSLQENGWLSRALTWAADHLTVALIREIHWAKSPVPTLVVLMQNGDLVACTYDRTEQVLAWWRILVGAPVRSCAVANTANGAELWLSLTRGTDIVLERMPLHETGVTYLDSSVSGVVAADGSFEGLAHLVGQAVGIVVDGALRPSQVVQASQDETLAWHYYVTVDVADAGLPITVGLPYRATGRTLPTEGGMPGGTAQGAKRRRPRISVRLNDSALPLINGYRPADRTPATPMDQPEPRITGDVRVANLGWSDDGVVTIEQDLPLRTEILAIFGTLTAHQT